jgi:hypothetical protein
MACYLRFLDRSEKPSMHGLRQVRQKPAFPSASISAVRAMSGQHGHLSADNAALFCHLLEMALECAFQGFCAVGTGFAIYPMKASFTHPRRITMKFETLMLNSFFAACVVICVSTLSAMLA